MRGLTPEEFGQVMSFVQKHHKFGYVAPEDRIKPDRFMWIKYVDTCWDTRDQTFWVITFRQGSDGVCFSSNHFSALNSPPKGWKYDNLFDLCMAYLKYEFEPKAEFYINKDRKPPKELERDEFDELPLHWAYKLRRIILQFITSTDNKKHHDFTRQITEQMVNNIPRDLPFTKTIDEYFAEHISTE